MWNLIGRPPRSTDSAQLGQKIDMKVLAAIFTVGDDLESQALLEFHDFTDRGILRGAQFLGADVLGLEEPVARVE